MIHQLHIPAPPLDSFIEFLWFYDDFIPEYGKEKLLPDGSMELIIDLREHPKYLYDRSQPDDLSRATPFRRSWLSGTQREYLVIGASPGSMMGVHFKPGGAWPFLGCPLSEFAEQVVSLEDVLGDEAAILREQLLAAPTFERKFAILERFLLVRGRGRFTPDAAFQEALGQLVSVPVKLLVRDLASRIGVSHNHLTRLFDQRLGIGPKQMDRILRFQRVLGTLSKLPPGEVDWVGIALDCGYYDQAHFIHDFTDFAGMTPTTYLQNRVADQANYVVVDPVPPASA